MKTVERYQHIVSYFEQARPTAQSELHYDNPFQLLVAVILSAQCTDRRVNQVTPALFQAYPTAAAMAAASVEDIFGYIRSVSYPNNKSRHLKGMSEKLLKDFGGEVPSDIEALQTLPGVGRKTANVIAAVIFNQAVMPVDTHVFRVSERIGLTTRSKTPLQTEKTLEKYIPAEIIPLAHHWLLLHGRYVCTARNPHCADCGIALYCRTFQRKQRSLTSSQTSLSTPSVS